MACKVCQLTALWRRGMNVKSKEDLMKEDLKIGDTVTADCHVYPNDGGGADYIVVETPTGKSIKEIKGND